MKANVGWWLNISQIFIKTSHVTSFFDVIYDIMICEINYIYTKIHI